LKRGEELVQEVERTAKNFFDNGMFLIASNVLWIPLMSAIPSWSFKMFLSFMVFALIETIIAWVWWKKPLKIVRFNSLTGYIQIFTMSTLFCFPMFRITEGNLFWIALALYTVIVTLSLFKRELIFQTFHNPQESKLFFVLMGLLVVIMTVGGLSAYRGRDGILMAFMNDHQKTWHVSTIFYFMGLLLIIICSSLLKKPEEIEYGTKKRAKSRSKSRSRSQRKQTKLKRNKLGPPY
jgi:hypothetical protein